MKKIIPNIPVELLALALTLAAAINTTVAYADCTPPPAGIVGWWKGDGTAVDVVSSNNGTLVNCGYTNGVVGQAFSFDPIMYGAYTGVQIADQPAYALTNALTIEGWIRPRGDGYNIFWRGDNRPGLDPYFLGMSGNSNINLWITDPNGNTATAGTTIPYYVWTHVAGTFDGDAGTMSFYTNGVLAAQTVTPIRPFGNLIAEDSPGIGIGNVNDGFNSFPFVGDIDEIALYKRALTQAEIQAIYNAGSAGKCTSPATESNGVPAIFSFAPTASPKGTTVTISGTNFSTTPASNTVYFGTVRASVLSASPTNLTVAVPTGATYAPVTVTLNGLTAYSSIPFLPTFPGGVSLYSTSLSGSFNLSAGDGPALVDMGDLDGDGKPDVVVANVYDGTIWIYRNVSTNGVLSASSFAPPVIFTIGGGTDCTWGLTLADLTGCGRLDIVVANRNFNTVSIFQNFCTPGNITTNSFGNRVDLPVAGTPFSVAVMDLDGDGKPEIITTDSASNEVSVLKNMGTSGTITTNSFGAPINFAVGSSPERMAVADMDGDGKPDVVTINFGDNDNAVSVLRNISTVGNIAFAATVNFPGLSDSFDVAIGDLDGDGKPDLAVSSSHNGQAVSIYRNTSVPGSITTNSFAPHVDFDVGGWGNTVAMGDLDGDGKLDVVVLTQLPDHLSLFRNISTAGNITTNSFAPRIDYSTGWNPNGIAIGDLDGDGRPDITFGVSYSTTLSIYQNQSPFCTPLVAPVITAQPTNLTVAVNGTAVFNVTADGSAPLNYQWSFNGTNLAGATNVSLTLSNVQPSQAGNYFVTVSNLAGSVVSSNARLTVYVPSTPPTILTQAPSQIVLLGHTATFSVVVDGAAPLSYFWSRNGALIPDATNSIYALLNAQLSDSDSQFSCLVTNAFGSASSTNASLKVIDSTIANDLCSGAIVVTNASYTNAQSTLKATSFGAPVPDCVAGFGHGVWYQFTTPVAGRLIVDTLGSDFDTGLALYTGSCDALTEVACNDDFEGATSQVTVPTMAGTTYFILAGGYGSDAGNLVLHLNYLTPPAFDVKPANLLVAISSNALFSPTLSGTQPMSFQWYFNNTLLADDGHISGSTNATLTITNVQMNDGGNYLLVASNLVGVTTSTVAVLTPIILPPAITVQPLSQSIPIGSNVNFSAAVAGTPPYSFQWNFNGNPLADDGTHVFGATTISLSLSNLTTADAGNCTLIVSNASGTTTSDPAVLIVMTPPATTMSPVGRSVPPGLPTIFTASFSGVPTPDYQWQLNGTNIPGATSLNYTNAAIGTNDLGYYQVIASNSMGVATSASAQLTFGPVAAWGRNLSFECLPPPGLSNVIGVAGCFPASFAVRNDGSLVSWGSGAGTNTPASASNVVAVATGISGNYALCADGSVVGWSGITPPALSNIVAVAEGCNFALALRVEGTVVGWGYTPGSSVPGGLNHVTAIACGYGHSLALRNDGSVVGWGAGAATNVPAGLTNVTAIAAGYMHSLALKADGTVVAWGSGSGTNLPASLTNITAISTENILPTSLSLALRANGTVVAWGDNPYGETNPPAALNNLPSVAIAAAPYHGLALVNDGSPQILRPPVGLTTCTGRDVTLQARAVGAAPLSYQWRLNGANVSGATNASLVISNIQSGSAGSYQLSVSNAINTAISLPAPLTVISNNTLTLLSQTTNNLTNYQGAKIIVGGVTVLGNGPLRYQWFASPTNRNYTAVPGATSDTLVLNPALAVQSGNYYLAVSNQVGGTTSAPVNIKVLFARSWGSPAVTNPPVNVTNAIAVATGNDLYLALSTDGKLAAWANYNYNPIYGGTNVSALSNYTVTAIAAGNENNLALKSDGTVYAWGLNLYGQTNPPSGLGTVTAIACGDYHDLALKADGTVVGWGATSLNLGTTPPYNYGQASNNPAATNVVAIAAGARHSLALRADGTVVGWGYIFDNSTITPYTATNVIAIAAGSGFSAALRANGTVVQWGSGLANYPVPPNLSNVVAIAGAATHCTALRNDGTVVSWGYKPAAGNASTNVPLDLANVIALASGGDHDIALLGTRAPAFTVQPWSRAIPANVVTNITLTAKCAGVQPMHYQWQWNGTNLPGATNDTLSLGGQAITGAPIPISTGAYQLIASNAYGVVTSHYAKVTTFIPLGTALNATSLNWTTDLNWTTSGSAPWFGETNVTHDGVSAAQSGGIGASQETILQTIFATNQPGSCSFWWKVSSEQDFDFLEFRINGVGMTNISGAVDWQQVTIPVAAGTNVLQWRYSKDATFDSGLDAGWVDQFAFNPAPVIIQQPVSQIANVSNTVTFSVAATGVGPMTFTWFGTPDVAPGVTNIFQVRSRPGNAPVFSDSFILSNVNRTNNGVYFVTVSNAGGTTYSTKATLQVRVPQQLGTPALLPDGSLRLTSDDVNGGTLTPADLVHFEAQSSTDLVNWVTLPNALSLTNGVLQLQDSSRTNYAARFYRIIEH
jgi:alpha-tubulin suppressor-like RCC1 family protein